MAVLKLGGISIRTDKITGLWAMDGDRTRIELDGGHQEIVEVEMHELSNQLADIDPVNWGETRLPIPGKDMGPNDALAALKENRQPLKPLVRGGE